MFLQTTQRLNVSDADIASDTKKSRNQQLDQFIREHERRLFKVLMMSIKDQATALDILQDTLLAFVKYYGDQSKPSDWPALIYRILQNKVRDYFRQHKVRSRWTQLSSEMKVNENGGLLEKTDPEPPIDQRLDQQQRMTYIEKMINELPERQQQVLILRTYAELSEAETAAALSISVGSVKTHLSRARDNLRSGFVTLGMETLV